MNILARISACVIFAAVFLVLPSNTFAQGLAPACAGDACTFTDFIDFIIGIIDFLIRIGVPIAIILFSYAGFLYLTSGAKPAQRSQANNIFVSVFVGFVIMLSAWLMVGFVTNLLLDNNQVNTNPEDVFKPKQP